LLSIVRGVIVTISVLDSFFASMDEAFGYGRQKDLENRAFIISLAIFLASFAIGFSERRFYVKEKFSFF